MLTTGRPSCRPQASKIKAKGRAKALPIFYSVGGFNAAPLYYSEVLGAVWVLQKMELEENGRKGKKEGIGNQI